jgi:hypothetical protein
MWLSLVVNTNMKILYYLHDIIGKIGGKHLYIIRDCYFALRVVDVLNPC